MTADGITKQAIDTDRVTKSWEAFSEEEAFTASIPISYLHCTFISMTIIPQSQVDKVGKD